MLQLLRAAYLLASTVPQNPTVSFATQGTSITTEAVSPPVLLGPTPTI